jgi:hypothetical protein
MSATFVIWASRPERGGLTLGEKVVWYHTWAMDQGGADGCYMGDQSLADRIGLKIRTVEQLRYRLRALGLLVSFKRAEGDNTGWIAVLPLGCKPSSGRAAGREAFTLAEKLDGYLCERDPDRATAVAEKATCIAPNGPRRSPGSLSSGKAVAVVVQSEAQLPPAVTSTEDGVVARATRARKEDRDPRLSEQLGMPAMEFRVIPGAAPSDDPVIRAALDELGRRLA